jgi:hypothetical protein
VCCRSPPRFILEIDVGERLPIGVTDDEAGVGLLGGPWRREAAALNHCPAISAVMLFAEATGASPIGLGPYPIGGLRLLPVERGSARGAKRVVTLRVGRLQPTFAGGIQ